MFELSFFGVQKPLSAGPFFRRAFVLRLGAQFIKRCAVYPRAPFAGIVSFTSLKLLQEADHPSWAKPVAQGFQAASVNLIES